MASPITILTDFPEKKKKKSWSALQVTGAVAGVGLAAAGGVAWAKKKPKENSVKTAEKSETQTEEKPTKTPTEEKPTEKQIDVQALLEGLRKKAVEEEAKEAEVKAEEAKAEKAKAEEAKAKEAEAANAEAETQKEANAKVREEALAVEKALFKKKYYPNASTAVDEGEIMEEEEDKQQKLREEADIAKAPKIELKKEDGLSGIVWNRYATLFNCLKENMSIGTILKKKLGVTLLMYSIEPIEGFYDSAYLILDELKSGKEEWLAVLNKYKTGIPDNVVEFAKTINNEDLQMALDTILDIIEYPFLITEENIEKTSMFVWFLQAPYPVALCFEKYGDSKSSLSENDALVNIRKKAVDKIMAIDKLLLVNWLVHCPYFDDSVLTEQGGKRELFKPSRFYSVTNLNSWTKKLNLTCFRLKYKIDDLSELKKQRRALLSTQPRKVNEEHHAINKKIRVLHKELPTLDWKTIENGKTLSNYEEAKKKYIELVDQINVLKKQKSDLLGDDYNALTARIKDLKKKISLRVTHKEFEKKKISS